jgi:hypothetical protein
MTEVGRGHDALRKIADSLDFARTTLGDDVGRADSLNITGATLGDAAGLAFESFVITAGCGKRHSRHAVIQSLSGHAARENR